MTSYDVFKGGADGILSLVQLRLAKPKTATLLTGPNHKMDLLNDLNVDDGDEIIVLSLPIERNWGHLERLLNEGANIFFVDHHVSEKILEHKNFSSIIDSWPSMCSAMLVDAHLKGAFRAWAITAALGSEQPALAQRKAKGLNLPLGELKKLGLLLNYNSSCESIEDFHINPNELFERLVRHSHPMDFISKDVNILKKLEDCLSSDIDLLQKAKVLEESDKGVVIEIQHSARSRGAADIFIENLSLNEPYRVFAIMVLNENKYHVKIYTPQRILAQGNLQIVKFPSVRGDINVLEVTEIDASALELFLDLFIHQLTFLFHYS